MENLILRLKEKGLSKWKIAKKVGVSWQTVHMWEKGTFKPKGVRLKSLNSLAKKMGIE